MSDLVNKVEELPSKLITEKNCPKMNKFRQLIYTHMTLTARISVMGEIS